MGRTGLGELTQRQIRVAVMISQGATDRDIMQNMQCSIYTVRSEIDQIIDKLGANNRAHIAYFVGLWQGLEWCYHQQTRQNGATREQKRDTETSSGKSVALATNQGNS
jgi:DNA-binding CsgD family transcriptional regulator